MAGRGGLGGRGHPVSRPACVVAFDVDDCLMPVNQAATGDTRAGLKALSDAGARLIFASGKPCSYLSGLARGLGLMDSSLVGENGAEIWLNSTMPPQRLRVELSDEERAAMRAIRERVDGVFGDRVFFQPNTVGVTAFPAKPGLTPQRVADAVDFPVPPSITLFIHVDSADWAVTRLNKGASLEQLARHLGIPMDRVAAVGDGENDVPMLEVAALALWLGAPGCGPANAVECSNGIGEVLERLRMFVETG